MFAFHVRNACSVEGDGFLIKDFTNNSKSNKHKLFGVLNYCKLPIRRFPSKSLPPNSVQTEENSKQLPKINVKNTPKYSLSNLIHKSLTNKTENIKISQPKKIFQKLCSTQSENFNRKFSDSNEMIFPDKIKPKSVIGLKSHVKKLKKNIKYKRAVMKSLYGQDGSETYNHFFIECLNMKNSLTDICKKRQSFQIITRHSLSGRLTNVTRNSVPEPLPRQRFLPRGIINGFKDFEDTFFGIDENLESSSQMNKDGKKTAISSVSFYITANSEIKDSCKETNLNSQSLKSEKKVYISCFEKQFQKVQLFYPIVGTFIMFPQVMDESENFNEKIVSKKNQVKNLSNSILSKICLDRKSLIFLQENNNNLNDDEESMDSQTYFRQAHQLLCSNSSQIQNLIYGHDTNNSQSPSKVDIQPFIKGERAEPKECCTNIQSNSFPPLKIVNKCKFTSSEPKDDAYTKPDINTILSSNNEKKPQIGPALQNYMKRRQQAKIEAQENDYNQMLSRARMIKTDHINSEFNSPIDERENYVYSPDCCESSTKTLELMKKYKRNHNKKSDSSSSSSSASSSSTYSEDSKSIDSNNTKPCNIPRVSCLKNKSNSNPENKSVKIIKPQVKTTTQHKNTRVSESEEDEKIVTKKKAEKKPVIHFKDKHVQFREGDIENDGKIPYKSSFNESTSRPDTDTISDKISQMEQNISTISVILNNVIGRMTSIEMNYQQFSENFLKLQQEIFDPKSRFPTRNPYMNYRQGYQQINNSMTNNISGLCYWDHGC